MRSELGSNSNQSLKEQRQHKKWGQSFVAINHAQWQNHGMKTLDEIERAADKLPTKEKAELLLFLAQSLREAEVPLPAPRIFSDEQLQAWMDEDEQAMRRFRAGT
jgi:hypothetical protein